MGNIKIAKSRTWDTKEIRTFLPEKQLKSLYNAFIKSFTEYGVNFTLGGNTQNTFNYLK